MMMMMEEQLPSTGFPKSMLGVDGLAIHCFLVDLYFGVLYCVQNFFGPILGKNGPPGACPAT